MGSSGAEIYWILLLIAIVGDFVVAYVLAAFYPGYSHMKQVMSVLGNPNSPVSLLYSGWLVTLGILLCISSLNFYSTYAGTSRGYAMTGAILIVVFGVGAGILSGIFRVDDGDVVESMAAKIHGIAAGIGFMLLMFVPLIVGMLSFKQGFGLLGWISMASFILSIVFFALFIMSDKESFEGTVIGLAGLWQRLSLASMYTALLLISIRHIWY